jgi:hypothetical protein
MSRSQGRPLSVILTGVEGVFRRCCEETLRVLRERSSVIMTILEVFKSLALCTRALVNVPLTGPAALGNIPSTDYTRGDGSRLNYSRSVATTSIIGHVVGLGDRHVSNILMDEAMTEERRRVLEDFAEGLVLERDLAVVR